jgi:KDO2-lipid IV(A) lauroyltransferase
MSHEETRQSISQPGTRSRKPRRAEQIPLYRFIAPRFWPIWMGIGLVRAVTFLLPYRALMTLGRAFGRLAWRISKRDRRIADVNIRLCLPEMAPHEREQLIKRHFESLGCTLFETALVWWASERELRPLMHTEGVENIHEALAKGRGAIVLSAHFTTLEIGARALALYGPTSLMYMTPRNPLIAEFSRRGRSHAAVQAIPAEQVRDLLQNLKDNVSVWYAPDQRYTEKNGALVPFFGRPAATNVATSRIARITGAAVLPYFTVRLPHGKGYALKIYPALENFPSADPVHDAAVFHALIEKHVRECPEQYLWTYKRFKLPGAGGDPYKSAARVDG